MVEIQVTYQGQLRCQAIHGPSRNQLLTDAPADNQGRGESFSPTDLLATALGACMMTVLGILARRKGWKLDGATVTVDKEMVADPVRRVGRLGVRFTMPSGIPEEARAQDSERHPDLAARRAGKELAQGDEVRVARLVDPAPPDHVLLPEVAEVRHGPAERREAEPRGGEEHLEHALGPE